MVVSLDKRKPLLADVFLGNSNSLIVHTSTHRHVQQKMRVARRFVLDEAGTRRYAEVIRDIPDLILREQVFARAPYDVTWIEFNFRTFWEVVNGRTADMSSDKRIGFLIDHDTAYVVSDGMLMPIAYDLHQAWDFEEQLKFANMVGVSRIGIDKFLWGSVYDRLEHEERRVLRDHNIARALPFHAKLLRKEQDILSGLIVESYADLRNIIGILLLMNRPSLTTYVRDVPHIKGFIRGKMGPYMSHTVVTINIDPKLILRLIGTSQEGDVEKRRHEVRGTWCHDETYHKATKNGCIHTWIVHPKYAHKEDKGFVNEYGEIERDNWQCAKCLGHRWRRDKHVRGSSIVGYVNKEYVITR